jgi:hypothetical protein
MSENSLYTREAWRIFLSRLSERGVLSVSRWYFQERPAEIYRLVALASAALQDAGIPNPRAHLLLIRNLRDARGDGQPEGVGTLLISRSPFSPDDLARLQAITAPMRFEITLDPNGSADSVLNELTAGGDVDAFAAQFPVNIAPPTDNSPFFFQMLRLRDIAGISLLRAGKNSNNMQAVFVLGVLMVTVLALAAVCLAVPRLQANRPSLRGSGALVVFFAAIGLGFMMIETSQMQRLITVLGHPSYSLSVVLVSVLLSGGVGSYLTSSIATAQVGRTGFRLLLALILMLIMIGLATPAIARVLEGATTPVRIAVTVAVLMAPGLLMGMAFPLGMRLARNRETLTPWLWGVNGALSVCASVLSVGIALSWSIAAAYWCGCAAYVTALAAFTRARGSAQ